WGITLPPISRRACSVSTGWRRTSRCAGCCSLRTFDAPATPSVHVSHCDLFFHAIRPLSPGFGPGKTTTPGEGCQEQCQGRLCGLALLLMERGGSSGYAGHACPPLLSWRGVNGGYEGRTAA